MAITLLKDKLYTIIFGTDTPAGKLFDLVLIYTILFSVAVVMLDSITLLAARYGGYLSLIEWLFTLVFTLEYLVRIYCSPNRWRYILSFYGLVDLLAILPSYLGIFIGDITYLMVIRLLRVLRIFRVLKLMRYLTEANLLLRTLFAGRRKVFIFFSTVLVMATVFGSLMFIVEGPANGFTSIPKSIYWTIVTITTVGYGDITPHTTIGQMIAALVMLTGYSIIAVPTGIFTAELVNEMQRCRDFRRCQPCGSTGHETDASYCRSCGAKLLD